MFPDLAYVCLGKHLSPWLYLSNIASSIGIVAHKSLQGDSTNNVCVHVCILQIYPDKVQHLVQTPPMTTHTHTHTHKLE